jgi:hypothetical protein
LFNFLKKKKKKLQFPSLPLLNLFPACVFLRKPYYYSLAFSSSSLLYIFIMTATTTNTEEIIIPNCQGCLKPIEEGAVVAFGDSLFHVKW